MELLNNIWVALSTPNEGLIKSIIFISTFIEAFLLMDLCLILLNINGKKKQKMIYIISMVILGSICHLFVPNPFNIFINYATMVSLIYVIFRPSFLRTLISSISSMLIFGMIGFLILTPFLSLLNISYEQSEIIPIYRSLYLITMYISTFIVIYLLKIRNIGTNIIDEIDKKSKKIIFTNFTVGICMLAILIFLTYIYVDSFPSIFIFVNFVLLLIFFCINFYSLTSMIKLNITTKKLESAEEYNKTLHILHDNVRGFKHDFDNIVTTIGGFINTNDMEGLKKYYTELEDDCERVNNLYILNPDVVNNPGIYNLLTSKYHDAEDKGINVKLSFFINLNEIHIKIYELARILGILLDNAIDASNECKEDNKIINIIFRKEVKKHRNIIIIENTYANKDVNTETIFNKGISSKENHTGIRIMGSKKTFKEEPEFKPIYP